MTDDVWYPKETIHKSQKQLVCTGTCADLVYWELARHCGLDVSSSFCSQVHHHWAILHALYHWFGDEDGSAPACDVQLNTKASRNYLSHFIYMKVQIKRCVEQAAKVHGLPGHIMFYQVTNIHNSWVWAHCGRVRKVLKSAVMEQLWSCCKICSGTFRLSYF